MNETPATTSLFVRHPAIAYTAPFAAFLGLMALEHALPFPSQSLYPVRFALVLAITIWLSRPLLRLRPSRPVASILLGIAVFAVWVAPDVLFHYRGHWLFANAVMGKAASSLAPHVRADWLFLVSRVLGTALLVPVIEELFWRGWALRWAVDVNFEKVPVGTYTPASFWLVAALFASEHGAYWEVGLAAGILYNWWMIRTRNLADCILAHAVTNGVLAAYVIGAGKWEYWL